MNLEPLITYFENYIPLKEAEIQLLNDRVTERQVKRRQAILQEGYPCLYYSFVVSGCFRMYSVDLKGNEHTIQFAQENDRPSARWIADISSFHSGKPSKMYIEAIEPSIVLQITAENLYFLYNNIGVLNRIFKVITEEKYIELQNRVLQTISSTAQERYLTFQEQYPQLAQRVPNVHIASYLGITPEFLSKIRKDMTS